MDQLADMFVKIKNANSAGHDMALIGYSQIKFDIAKLLEASGFVRQAVRRGKKARRLIEIHLKKEDGRPSIAGFRRISRSSRRIYGGWREMRRYAQGRGTLVVSTPRGVLTHEEAIKQKVGGEIMGIVW
ncbi:MAG: 30S ribosomal protein S8 [Patescibacteria group bacterium]